MKKDEIIELLKEQISGLRADNDRLLLQVEALTQEIASLNEALLQKGESLSRQQRIAKGLAKLMSNSSEKQNAAQIPLSEEEQRERKRRKLPNAKPGRTTVPGGTCITIWKKWCTMYIRMIRIFELQL